MKNKYRKNPLVVEAIQWTGDNITELRTQFPNFIDSSWIVGKTNELFINTLEGPMHASVNDYIIMGIDGEFYACKPDKFAKTYTKVEGKEE